MKPETRAAIDQANREWNEANADVEFLCHAVGGFPEGHQIHAELLGMLTEARAKRSDAGGRHAAAMLKGLEEIKEEAAGSPRPVEALA